MKFTARMVEALRPKESRYEVWEDGRNGFGVRVSPKGQKSWVYLYWFDGVKRRMTLGRYPEMTLADAHSAHSDAEGLKERGVDPGTVKVKANQDQRDADTVKDVTEAYMRAITGKKKTAYEDQRVIDKDILPAWGRRKAKDLIKRDVIGLLDTIVARGAPIQANRTLAVIRRMFNWAISRDIVLFNPCQGIEAPGTERQRDRVLSKEEIKSLWNNLPKCKIATEIQLAIKFQLVTIQRKGEIVQAERSEIDFGEKVWTIPAEKAKNGLAHRVPLSDMAIEILEQVMELDKNSEWVFASSYFTSKDSPIKARSVDHAIKNNMTTDKNDVPTLEVGNVRPHDLRRTGASFMTSIGIPRLTVSKILNHAERDVTAVYDRHSYDTEKRRALDAWAAKLNEIIEDRKEADNVVPLQDRRG